MPQYLNKEYVLVRTENFEDYLIFMGKGYLERKVALSLRPTQMLTQDEDGVYNLSFNSRLVKSNLTFTPDVEFDEVRPDGVKVRSSVTIDGNKLVHIQCETNGRTSKHVREFFHEEMVITTTADGFENITKRYFEIVRP